MTSNVGLLMKYFVLKPDGTDVYAQASRAAMKEYAKWIVTENLKLSDDLWCWAESLEQTLPADQPAVTS
jgi:hypothetical protein